MADENKIVVVTDKYKPLKIESSSLANTDVDYSNLAVVVPSIDTPCRIEREKRTEKNTTKKGSSLAAFIREQTKTLRDETDCLALQQKIFKELEGLKDSLDDSTKEIQRKLEEILPIIKLPLNPFKIPKWLVKFAIGRILPDLEATIDLIKRTVELGLAITELITTIQDLVPRLEACAVSTISTIEASVRNEIEKTLVGIRREIENAIADALCEGAKELGISADDIQDILESVSAVNTLVNSVKQLQTSVTQSIDSSLSKINQNQNLIQEITGIPPVLDASSTEAFMSSVDSPEYAAYKSSVMSVLQEPDPVNDEVPVITGPAQFGSTLTCSNGVWSANGVVSTFPLSFQWFREAQEIQGANTFEYIPGLDDVEYPLYCRVVAETQTGIEEAITEKTTPVQFVLPVADAPVITGSAVNGQTLSCSDGTWPFTPTTVMFEWSRVPSVGANVRVQSLSSNNLYSVKSADVGSQIKCKVVASAFRYTLSVDTELTVTVT